jgi:hypothetical protein
VGRQFLKYGFGAIALYLLVSNGSNGGDLFLKGASGTGKVINAFQGKTVA